MKSFSPLFAAHLASGATTLCTCWRLQRTDGVVQGFTDHDVPLAFGGVEYAPDSGFTPSQAASKLGAASASTDLEGVVDSATITEADLELGRYRNAVVETIWANWRDPSVNAVMGRHTIGDISRADGYFRAELRSAQSALNAQAGRFYQSMCGVVVGSSACGIDLAQVQYRADATVTEILDRFSLAIAGVESFAAGWFGFGSALFGSGQRQGLSYQIESDTLVGGARVLRFAQTISDRTAPGDSLKLTAGCDRRFKTCGAKFGNQINFRGFPHIPGNDFLLAYPREDDSLTGGPLVP